MRHIAILSIIFLLAAIGYGQDYVNFQGVPAKELSGLNLSQTDEILGGNDYWMMLGSGQYTASQRAFLKENAADGKPIGASREPAVLGNLQRYKQV
jgi:hypothetical protein